MTKKICIFSISFFPNIGGLERIAFLIAKGLADSGGSVEVVTSSASSAWEVDEELPFKIHRRVSTLQKLNAARNADVILFFNISLHSLPIALFSGRPIVLSHHCEYIHTGIRNRILGKFKNWLTRFFQNICVSDYLAQKIPGECIVIPNAYDDKQFLTPTESADRDFVFCGRLVSDKGADILIDAFTDVVKSYPSTTLTIIGDGPELSTLQRIVEQRGLYPNVAFVGALAASSVASVLCEHACMVIPSKWDEPFGIVALEGVACCRTVISSNRGGLPEAVGPCGVLVPPTADDFAAAMLNVMEARSSKKPIPGEPTPYTRTRHLEKFRCETIVNQYLHALNKATGSPRLISLR